MLALGGFRVGSDRAGLSSRLQIGVKILLSIMEMARHEPESIYERLMGALLDSESCLCSK
jgi:hypothetical protein